MKELYKRDGVLCVRKQVAGKMRFDKFAELSCPDVVSVQLYDSKLERDETYRRRVTWCSENPDRAVVEYLGVFPAHVTNHKNSKSTGEYVRSNPKVIQKIKTEIENTKCKPKNIYTKLDNETDTERCKPRNLKQVQNCTASIDTDKWSTCCFSSKTNFADKMQQLCSNVTEDDFVQSVIFSTTWNQQLVKTSLLFHFIKNKLY